MAGRSGPVSRALAPARAGRRTVNSLPRPRPVAVRGHACRRASRPGASRARARARGPRWRSSARSRLREEARRCAAAARARSRCPLSVTPDLDGTLRALAAERRTRSCRPARCSLRGVGEEVREHLREPGRVRIAAAPARSGSFTVEPGAGAARPAAGTVSTPPARPHRPSSTVASAQARSCRRGLCARCRAGRRRVGAGARVGAPSSRARARSADSCPTIASTARCRCATARAGCAARAPGSRGTRPCGDRSRSASAPRVCAR